MQSEGDEASERLFLAESEVVSLLLEFLGARQLTSAQVELERESGVVNEIIPSTDLLFLRTLILDGRWDDVSEFLQPLEEAFRGFPGKKVKANILKHRFLDLLTGHVLSPEGINVPGSIGSNPGNAPVVEELVKVLSDYETVAESKEDHAILCALLTSPSRLAEHPTYKDWKSSTARLACFDALRPLVQRFIPPPAPASMSSKHPNRIAAKDRLVQLLIKGLLYETCVSFCQSKAVGGGSGPNGSEALAFSNLLSDKQLSESDLSLLSWLRSLPAPTFNAPFQRRSLRVDIEPLPKPQRTLMNVSIMDSASDLLSRSMASTSFHLSSVEAQADLKTMTTSVDRLFGVDSVTAGSTGQSRPQGKQQLQPQPPNAIGDTSVPNTTTNASSSSSQAKFIAVTVLEDVQAVRCAEFHPSGRVYAVGSNSKTLRVCAYPDLSSFSENHTAYQPTVLFKRTKHHKGSIYCLTYSPDGNLLATGSNDKTVKLLKFDEGLDGSSGGGLQGSQEVELSMHDGTVRDICFLEEIQNKTSLLVSGGAGDCKIYVTDCSTATPFQALSGHTGAILSLWSWGGGTQMFCSGSQDKTVRFWDLRTRGCVDVVTPLTSPQSTKSAVASVCVEPSGRLLACGHEDAAMILYDIRGQRQIQSMKSHAADVRSVRFSPAAYYLLSGGYDNRLALTDLQGDLSTHLPSVVVATHQDKVISGRFHPSEFSFLSTSADKTVVLWALPPEP